MFVLFLESILIDCRDYFWFQLPSRQKQLLKTDEMLVNVWNRGGLTGSGGTTSPASLNFKYFPFQEQLWRKHYSSIGCPAQIPFSIPECTGTGRMQEKGQPSEEVKVAHEVFKNTQ